MKKNILLKTFLVILGCVTTQFIWAQWADFTGAHTEEYTGSKVLMIGKTTGHSFNGYQVKDGNTLTNQYPIFQIDNEGKLVFGPPVGTKHAYLYFMQQSENYGSINTNFEDFHVDATRKLWLSARSGNTVATFDKNDVNFFGTTKINVTGTDTKGYFTFKDGKNGDGLLSYNLSNKWLRIGNPGGLAFWGEEGIETNDNPNFQVLGDRNVSNKDLYVNADIRTNSNSIKLHFGCDDSKTLGWIGSSSNHGVYLGANNHANMFLDSNYGVYVGLFSNEASSIRSELKAKYRLFVKKGVLAEDFGIAPINNWADNVFDDNYNLRSISDVELYIKNEGHLPEVPSAKKVATEGYSQHEMNKVLLKKIEELTLYVIQQQKELEILRQKLNEK